MLFITNKGVFMQGVEVGIEEVLMCRERRVDIQNEMIKKYNMPLISFTMNIPGPIKTNQQIKKAFDENDIVLPYPQMVIHVVNRITAKMKNSKTRTRHQKHSSIKQAKK